MSKLENTEPDSTSSSDNESGGDDKEHIPETIYLPNEEPKQYYLVIRREIEENENYDVNEAIIMLEEVMKIIRLSSDPNTQEVYQNSLSKEHYDYFMEEGLALILRELLVSRRFPEVGKGIYDIVIRVNEFFQRVLEFMIWSITNDGNLSLLDNLRRIFDDERFFYMQTSMLESERDEEEEKLPTFAVMPKPREFPRYGPHVPSMMASHYSPFLIQNINFFGRKGGFNAMLDRINKLDPKVNFQRLKLFVRIFAQLRDFLTNEVKDDIAPKLFSAISSYMLTLKDDELRPLERLEIEDLNRFLSMFIEKVPSMEGRAYEMLEKLTLDFSLKCFKSSLLDKQLNGLANIEEMVELAYNRERMGFMSQMEDYSHQMHSFYRTSRWVTVSFMVEWISNHKIIEELFVYNPHLELIKRCAKLLQMLGQKGALKSEHLDAIWNATVNKHETIINATLEVISEACTMLNEQQLKYLLDKISALSLKEYTERTLTLLVDFAKTMDSDIKNRALDMLWFLIIDENAHTVKLDVQIQALKKFGKLLGFYQFRNRRNELIQKFIETIKTGNSVLQSIHLLQCVIDTFSERESDMSMPSFYEESKKAVIIRLEKEAGLSELLIKELVEFKSKARTKKEENSLSDSAMNSFIVGIGRNGFIEEVKGRVDFLKFLLGLYPGLIAKDHVDTLWRELVDKALTFEDEELGLEWFQRLLDTEVSHEIDLVLYIFQEKLGNLEPSKMTPNGFKCFHKYFLSLNRVFQRMSGNDEVYDLNLLGYQTLWKIALGAKGGVLTDSIDTLIKLHLKVSKDFKRTVSPAEHFINSCMSHLTEAKNSNNIPMINTCITLLKTFLESSKPTIGVPQHFRGQSILIIIHNKIPESNPAALSVRLHVHDPVSMLRQSISQQLQIPPELIIMVLGNSTEAGGMELSDDKTLMEAGLIDRTEITLHKFTAPQIQEVDMSAPTEEEKQRAASVVEIFQISENAALVALKRNRYHLEDTITKLATEDQFLASVLEEASKMAPPPQKKPAETEPASPHMIIVSNPAYFDMLFELLQMEEIDKQKVWDMLMKLPTNKKMLENLQNFDKDGGDINWDNLLDSNPSAIYKLLYSLQIVDNLMEMNELEEDKESDRVKWCKAFLYRNGFRHIFKIFTTTQIDEQYVQSTAWKECLSLLLKIINFFIKTDVSVINDEFSNSVKETLRHSGNTLKKTVDFPAFVHMMLKLIWSIAKFSDVNAMAPAVSLLVVSLVTRKDLLRFFYSFPDLEKLIMFVLLEASEPEIRRQAEIGFHQIASINEVPSKLQHPHTFFLDLLLKNIPVQLTSSGSQYFDLLNKLIRDACMGKEGGSPAKFRDLLDSVIIQIKKRPIIELHRADTEDKVLIGLFSIVKTIVAQDPSLKLYVGSQKGHHMINELFHNCLFAFPNEKDFTSADQLEVPSTIAKCKTHGSRTMALGLLAELGKGCPENFVEIITLLAPHHITADRKEIASWDNPKVLEKSVAGYVGLKNLGSTCYVNSLMQQFFMIPEMRNELLSMPLTQDPKQLEENLLSQIQLMFGYLTASERQYYNPLGFCKAFKDWEGNSINTGLQQDVLEFFNILVDHLENLLKGTPQKKLLDTSFTGSLSQEFICQEGQHYSETAEPFYTISVDIKGKKNLYEALNSFVEGEVLEGGSAYSCGQCNKKVKAIKRCSIKKMSPTLIVHLKRFEYLIDRQSNHKLFDYFEFPLRLNIEPYTKAGIAKKTGKKVADDEDLPPPSYEYELVGVLVHSGHADSGHYYSFIKERSKGDSRENRWFRFDDTNISPWNINNLAEECFGGMQVTTYSGWNGMVSREQPRLKNAYMLFYERVKKDSSYLISKSVSLVPPQLVKQIREENSQLMKDRQLYDIEYFTFLQELIQTYHFDPVTDYNADVHQKFDPAFEAIQLSTFFLFESLVRVRTQTNFENWMKYLTKAYSNHIPASKWLLTTLITTRRGWFRYLLLECYDDYVRATFGDLLYAILKTLSPHEKDFYFQYIEPTEQEKFADIEHPVDKVPKSICVKFMLNFLDMMEFTRQHWRRFMQYWKLLVDYIQIGPNERQFLQEQQIVGSLVDYYMGPYSPNLKPGVQRVKIGDTNQQSDLKYFMQALSLMIRSHSSDGAFKKGRLLPDVVPGNNSYPVLYEKEKRLLYNRDLLQSLIKQGYSLDANRDLCLFYSFEDEERSMWVLEILLDQIVKANWNMCDNFFFLLDSVIAINDSIEDWRVEVAFNLEDNGLLDIIHYYKDRYPKFTSTCILFVIKALKKFPRVAGFLFARRKDWWTWLEPWLNLRENQAPPGDEVFEMNRDLKAFIDGTLETEHKDDYKISWQNNPNPDGSKLYKLYLAKN